MTDSLKKKNRVLTYVDNHRTPIAFAAGVAATGASVIYFGRKVDRTMLLQLSDVDMSKINAGDAARHATQFGTILIAKEVHLP